MINCDQDGLTDIHLPSMKWPVTKLKIDYEQSELKLNGELDYLNWFVIYATSSKYICTDICIVSLCVC